MSSKKLTNAEKFALALKRNGVEYIFGQSNPTKIMLASMELGIRQIAFRQENSGTYMAQAYAMASGKIPVVAAQNGPAATLLVPGLAEDLKAGHPVVAVVQEVALNQAEKNAFQEIDHEKLFLGCSKWVKKIYSAERIEDYVDMAFTVAASGKPGPAVLLCPQDIFNDKSVSEVTSARKMSLGHYPLDRQLPDPSVVKQAAELLLKAENPLVYAGGGVFSSQATEELRQLQKQFFLPVATTTMGKGSVDETDPLTVGVIGYYMGHRSSTRYLKPLVQRSDVILLIGNRTNQNGTDSWTLLPEDATYIHIDIDPLEIGRNYEALRLPGDAKLTIAALIEAMAEGDLSRRSAGKDAVIAEIREARKKHQEEIQDVISSELAPIRIERFMAAVEKQLGDDDMVVSDASFASIWNANYITAKGEREFYFPRGLAGLGWGLPMAMGCKLAKPGKKVFCLTGDGGFAHVWSELETCKREGIDVVCAVINNTRLGYQYYAELSKFGAYTNACDIEDVDYAKVAQACDLVGLTIERPEDIEPVLAQALAAKGTVIIDVKTERCCTPPLPFIDALKLAEMI
ncbi:acetolactate synthase catalytic subunit [Bacilliculturomica massiliensis]|uniref:acetolactate synthase catalytic subunit n=1 Tax=Bacilliculturomica massiliensis TaxID=1917867 RepID=UPI001A92AA26|nr:acetolactate synthase catalytic subunit [Bacilliculturomica massiliensis]